MAAVQSEDGSYTSREVLDLLAILAPYAGAHEAVAAVVHLFSSTADRLVATTANRVELHQQLAEAMQIPVETFSSQAQACMSSGQKEAHSTGCNSIDEACTGLVNSKLQLLFELWDRDGDGLVSFVDVALAFRKFSPAMQRLASTAADATEALYLFSGGGVTLDRLQFARLIEALAAAVSVPPSAMLDLLIILAGIDDRPAEELTLLLAEGAVQRKHEAMQTPPSDNGTNHEGHPSPDT